MTYLLRRTRIALGYAGVAAVDVAAAERLPLDVVRQARVELGRCPDDGQPGSAPARRAATSALTAEDFDRLMRANRSLCG